jgi:nicotinate-nucleotide--dimethylbenzimidazole phosphoribosyltransferase
MPFTTLAEFRALIATAPDFDSQAAEAAKARDLVLTKPPGALGRLEDLTHWLAGWQRRARPRLDVPQVVIFAGNHGVVARGVSAFPAEVTGQMVANFRAGGAAINQLAGLFGARMSVVELELARPTADFTTAPAMSEAETVDALRQGWLALDPEADLLIVGEMGIGNTTSAAAMASALFGGAPGEWAGRGTGLDDAGLQRKSGVIAEALALHAAHLGEPLQVLRCLGGREIAAMAGAIAHARLRGVPVILDGFICTAAAAVLAAVLPSALDHAVAGHVSAEPGHARLLAALGKDPLLALGMRLGEGSGAAVALSLVKAALACHSGMATFAEAGVSGKQAE